MNKMPPGLKKPEGFNSWREKTQIGKKGKLKKTLKLLEKAKEEEAKKSEVVLPTLDRPSMCIAIPGSILENAQSTELRTYLAGQIARAACIFGIDEVVVFDDVGATQPESTASLHSEKDQEPYSEKDQVSPSCVQMARILQYLECPQYLRKFFFPLHQDLQYAGLLNPLDAPHHLRQTDEFPFREGIVTNLKAKNGRGSVVNVGLVSPVTVDRQLEVGVRVTVKILPRKEDERRLKGHVVSPRTPEAATARYWGYSVRIASSLRAVFTEAPHPGGYDLTIGTSDKGQSIDEVLSKQGFPRYKHGLIVLGGLSGLEKALEADSVIQINDPSLLFDFYINSCPNQGTRTIRTEEALLITLAALRPHLWKKC